ncbi:MAG: CA_C0660 family putative sactipeptide bacteriocin [Lachnospiraceae bacterium]|nr:CA_C0660 family putative sactipeptide bacteriocin [Lachnospiraceae bacterium]
MKVVNPLNKAPLSPETMVNSGCHCVCSSGSNTTYAHGSVFNNQCECSCDGDIGNYKANYAAALDVGWGN